MRFVFFMVLFWISNSVASESVETWAPSETAPSVMVAILLRNKAHTLPFFLNYIQNLDYPKERIRLWIRSDHNIDNSVPLMQEWLARVQPLYNHVDFYDDNSESSYSDSEGPFDWSRKRVNNILRLRQEALNTARVSWVDYLMFVDCDNFLMSKKILKDLIRENKPIVAPMLNATFSKHYTNFWGDMDENGYYKRSDNYHDIHTRIISGIFRVPVVHSTFLIQTRHPATTTLAFYPPPNEYHGPFDDIIIFAYNCILADIPTFIVNKDFYGIMLIPMDKNDVIEDEKEQFLHLRLETIVLEVEFTHLEYMEVVERKPDKLGFDEVYLINLARRPDRRKKMVDSFKLLGINATIYDAVDGRLINETYIKKYKLKVLPAYADPYHGTRTMTLGEIGCFLSHYFVWIDVIHRNLGKVLVFEDDVRFRVAFRRKIRRVVNDLRQYQYDWDLSYIGRKKLYEEGEPAVGESEVLVSPQYSYWTIGYAMSMSGAFKLVGQQPLEKLIPVDEYIPIMFDRHPRDDWKIHYHSRDLVAVSTDPLLIEPTHYTGDPGYFTDTEESITIDTVTSKSMKRQRGDTGDLEVKSEL